MEIKVKSSSCVRNVLYCTLLYWAVRSNSNPQNKKERRRGGEEEEKEKGEEEEEEKGKEETTTRLLMVLSWSQSWLHAIRDIQTQ